jgi:GNAT superfamily N-acetyltransferase
LNLPDRAPFGLSGRLVVHPHYQGMGLSSKLISSRLSYCKKHNIQWLHAFVSNERVENKLDALNFNMIGQIDINYHEFTHPHTVNVFVKEYPLNQNEIYQEHPPAPALMF